MAFFRWDEIEENGLQLDDATCQISGKKIAMLLEKFNFKISSNYQGDVFKLQVTFYLGL